jgi:hypothetical protein
VVFWLRFREAVLVDDRVLLEDDEYFCSVGTVTVGSEQGLDIKQ